MLTNSDNYSAHISSSPSVYAIILNWNGWTDTITCLESILRVNYPALKVVVCDNGSSDGSIDRILEWSRGYLHPAEEPHIDKRLKKYVYPPVKKPIDISAIDWEEKNDLLENGENKDVVILRIGQNLGFTGGNNIGLEYALRQGADYILFLNNDTIVDKDFLRPIIAYCGAHPTTGIVAPVICYAYDCKRIWFATGKQCLALGYFESRQKNQHLSKLVKQPILTEHVTGCCMLLPSSVARRVGGFDERFFAFLEDTDLCVRVRRAGLDIACVGESVIWHKVSSSTRRGLKHGTVSPMSHYLSTRNRIAVVLKHGNLLEKVVFFLVGNPMMNGYYLAGFLLRRRWDKAKWLLRGILHGMRCIFPVPDMSQTSKRTESQSLLR
jgi:GT2 family glycosyltransferase